MQIKPTVNPGAPEYTIVNYEWTIDGQTVINNTDTLTINVLGNHIIALRVQNSCGGWSTSYSQNINGGNMQQIFMINVNQPIVTQTVVVNLTATVKITLKDSNNNPIPNATCVIGTISAVTDATGLATLNNVPYANQTLTVTV